MQTRYQGVSLRARAWCRTAACGSVLLVVLCTALPARATPGAVPRREDRGDLIVLHLYGSYYEMGRQQVDLLGPVARRMYAYHRAKYDRVRRAAGFRMQVLDAGMSLLAWVGALYEDSGFFEEINGIADALSVSRGDVLRAMMATAFGSTVFAATRSATADGGAIIGRNVDWEDGAGTMRPVLMHVHPTTGDLAYVMAGWPLIGAPAIGMNETGFALSFNFFVTDEIFGVPPRMRDRRALQTATTVADGLRVFTGVRRRAMPTFMVMADAAGDIAMIECTPSACAIFRPQPSDADWFAQANHARTEAMIPFDRYRADDSFRRLAAMEAAVRPHLGSITPQVAAQIVRDRSNSAFVNDATVANLTVLNSAVLHPASRTVWHSTAMQPLAPFGEMLPFSVGADVSRTPSLPADPRLGTAAMDHEAAVIADARRAGAWLAEGNVEAAGVIWDALAAQAEPLLHPDRLGYARAVVRMQTGRLEEADRLLAALRTDRAPFEVVARGLAYRGWIADRQGRRAEALAWYRQARAYLDQHVQWTDLSTEAVRAFVTAGLHAPHTTLPDSPDLQYVPR
jgi:hypothetical protein